jgi:hypothetical protein
MRSPFPLLCLVFAGAALAPPSAVAQTVGLHGDGLDLNMQLSAATPQAVSSEADLTTQLQGLQTHIQLGLETGSTPSGSLAGAPLTGSGWWNSGKLDLGATWAPTALAKIELSAKDSVRLEYDPADPVWADASQRYNQSRQSEARAAATFTPLSPLNLQIGAAASGSTVQDSSISGAGLVSSDLLQTDAQQMFTTVQWKPLGLISLDGGGKLESTGVYWSGARAGSYASLDPSVGATITPWSGASWRFSMERAAAPLTTDQFIGYAAVGQSVAGPAAGLTLQPNREWRYQATLEQKAGAVDLTARVLHAQLQSYAYLAPYGLDPGRVDMGQGQRSEVQAGLATPMSLFGVLPLTVKASGAWRTSLAADPLTGALGRLSGESPYDASLSLTQTAASWNMRWGMTAMATGPARSYLATQVSSRSATAGLGGFFEYHPGGVTLQLQLDNILGGDRAEHDVYYAGPRDLNLIDRIDDSRAVDRAVRLSLIRPL